VEQKARQAESGGFRSLLRRRPAALESRAAGIRGNDGLKASLDRPADV
jgi:hypothetical protein